MKFKSQPSQPIRLDFMLVQEVSPVGLAANNRKFLKIKSAGEGAPMTIKLSTNVQKTLQDVCKIMLTNAQEVSKMVADAEIDDTVGEVIPEELGGKIQALCDAAASVSVAPEAGEAAPEAKAEPAPAPAEEAPKEEAKAEPAPEEPKEEMSPEEKAAEEALKATEAKTAACAPEEKPAAKSADTIAATALREVLGEFVREVKKAAVPQNVMTPPQGRSQVEPPRAAPSEDSVWDDFGAPNSQAFRKQFGGK